MGWFKTESPENAGGLTVLAGFPKRVMKVYRTKRVDKSVGAFPRADETILFTFPSTMARGEDQASATTSFDMSSYEVALASEISTYGESNDARLIHMDEVDSDDVHLLSKNSESTKKSRRFRGTFRFPLKHWAKWKSTVALPAWKKGSGRSYTDAAENTEGTEESSRTESKWRIRYSFSDWAGRIVSSSNSVEHITHNNASSNEASISSSDFDTNSGPAQFFPARDGGLGLFTML
jgi:hypothetical protein